MPLKGVSEFYPLVPPGVVASRWLMAQGRHAPGCIGMEQEHGKALKDVMWQLRGFAEGSSC